jgi:hypothetical protein
MNQHLVLFHPEQHVHKRRDSAKFQQSYGVWMLIKSIKYTLIIKQIVQMKTNT